MKFILLNDISYLFNYKKKVILAYILVSLIYFWFNVIIDMPIDLELFYNILGVNCNLYNYDWLNILIFMFNISIYFYISFEIFTNDLENGIDNIFLRIKSSKWIVYKILSILFISLFMMLTVYIILLLVFYIMGVVIQLDIILFLKNLIYILLLQNTGMLIFTIFSKYKLFLPIFISLFIISINYAPTNIVDIKFIYLASVFFINCIFLIIIFKYLYVSVFERK